MNEITPEALDALERATKAAAAAAYDEQPIAKAVHRNGKFVPAPLDDEDDEKKERSAIQDGVPPWDERIIHVDDPWYLEQPPTRAFLLRDSRDDGAPYLPKAEATQLVAAGGAGKTQAIAQLAVSIATGSPWLGTFTVEEPGPVLLCIAEEKEGEVRRRLFKAARAAERFEIDHGRTWKRPARGTIVALPLSGKSCAMLTRPDRFADPVESEFYKWLLALVKKHGGFRLLSLDPLSRFAGPDAEKDNAAGTRFVECIEALTQPSSATALVAHHTPGSSRGREVDVRDITGRGVTALHDGFRWQASLGERTTKIANKELRKRLASTLTLLLKKSNYTGKIDPLILRREIDGGALAPLDSVDLEILSESSEEEEKKKAARDARDRDSAARKAKREAEAEAMKLAKEKAKAATKAARVAADEAAERAKAAAKEKAKAVAKEKRERALVVARELYEANREITKRTLVADIKDRCDVGTDLANDVAALVWGAKPPC